jgi:hypothetical protein
MPSFHFDPPSLVIGVVIAGIGFFFSGFLREAGKDAYSWIKRRWWPQVEVDPEKTAPQVHVHVQGSEKVPPKHDPPQLNDVTLEAIAAALDNVPPLQQKAIAAHYVGLRVQWDLNLVSADRLDGDQVRLFLQSRLGWGRGVNMRGSAR